MTARGEIRRERERDVTDAAADVDQRLTRREREIVGLIGKGLSNKEIAGSLRIEVPTVKKHVHHILEKLSVRRRTDAVAAAQIIYLEGYLWDPPHAKEAFLKAAKIAHGAERDVALTLSDAFCVGRYRAEFLDLIRTGTVDIVFANESELHSLYETSDFDTAVNALRNDVRLAVITRSEKGCLVVTREETDAVPASPIERMVDATGAGDTFDGAFLARLLAGDDIEAAARYANVAAALSTQGYGAVTPIPRKDAVMAAMKRPNTLTC